ncbi:MAG: SpoIIIAH-like family protein [Clostridia bacterium]|nr:SpoIIIAH-like family protein [Clostridia bacterium]
MKFIKKYLVLAVVAVLFAGAFVLNVMVNGESTEETNVINVTTENSEASVTEDAPPADYFETFRQDREEVRQLEMEYLDEVIAASRSDQETLADAQKQKMTLVENMEKEFAIESMIKAKGFEDAAVTFHSGTVNVVVKSEELEESSVAQILDIVQAQTGEPARNIKVIAGQ